jgi:hypothetical protein
MNRYFATEGTENTEAECFRIVLLPPFSSFVAPRAA